MEWLSINQSAVGSIGEWRIGVSNIWERDYTDAEGGSKTGITAQFTLWQEGTDPQAVTRIIVYPGMLFQLGDHQYRVIEISGGNGSSRHVVIDPRPVSS